MIYARDRRPLDKMKDVRIGNVTVGHGHPLCLIAGPCVIESETGPIQIAKQVKEIADRLGMPYIFKASYEKDNRGAASGFAGPGLKEGLRILARVKEEVGVPVLSDIHRQEDVDAAAEVLDVIQIPAYLCQQTSLVLAVDKTGRAVNVKKGQFLAPENMSSAVNKLEHVGNERILLTERGSSFGYNRLVADFRSIPIMQSLGYPVVFDATHIVRIYGIPSSDPRGGEPQFVPPLARAAAAAGTNAIFLETHPEPSKAKCDASSMVPLGSLESLLTQVMEIASLVRRWGLA